MRASFYNHEYNRGAPIQPEVAWREVKILEELFEEETSQEPARQGMQTDAMS